MQVLFVPLKEGVFLHLEEDVEIAGWAVIGSGLAFMRQTQARAIIDAVAPLWLVSQVWENAREPSPRPSPGGDRPTGTALSSAGAGTGRVSRGGCG